jgi:hypothetical protein
MARKKQYLSSLVNGASLLSLGLTQHNTAFPFNFMPPFKGKVGDKFYSSSSWASEKKLWVITECRDDRPFVLAEMRTQMGNTIQEAFLKVDFQTGVIKLSGGEWNDL